MTTKLKIDLSQGLLEVEGSEAFVRNIYADFKAHFAGVQEEAPAKPRRSRRAKPKADTPAVAVTVTTTTDAEPSAPEDEPVKEPAPAKSSASKKYQHIDDLELEATDDHPALIEFMDAKFPITNPERNVVFLYFLQNMLKLKSIKPDHLYTCYRAAKIRAPQNIESTIDYRGWIKSTKTGNLSLTADGRAYVEQQLPKRVKQG